MIIYAATASVSGNFSSKVQCTESVVVVYATTLGGSSVVYSTVTTTVVESYSSIVNNSATINHTTTFTANTDHAIQVRLANASLISVSDQHLESVLHQVTVGLLTLVPQASAVIEKVWK